MKIRLVGEVKWNGASEPTELEFTVIPRWEGGRLSHSLQGSVGEGELWTSGSGSGQSFDWTLTQEWADQSDSYEATAQGLPANRSVMIDPNFGIRLEVNHSGNASATIEVSFVEITIFYEDI